ncbi:UvrD-helicase domain-containing protein [Clostridium estertheticum]|uniref:ATP-dependent helicase n=1 Tax=Clostridium estertheticum TaxID=238834 RepID=A0AA47I8P1_9CLOT|nr:ATP-dependent helicase [Clostridium estertheticum]MBU3154481.1 ATP-dependent helicase [Clostridium estertheticum]WAG62080.1 ATP-dependent helicase [Clostridium estertheticum]
MHTKNLSISIENIRKEEQVFEKIAQCIDAKKSMVFDAGAGAGKTYSLLQSLKYIVNQYGKILKRHSQKILCITYTNIAVSEIKERLGNSSLIEVSTIHDCVWGIIGPYQKQLVEIHYEKINYEICMIEKRLESEKWAEKYRDLLDVEKNELLETMNGKKEDYYKHKNDNSALFKAALSEVLNIFPDLFRNVTNFKKIVDNLFRIQKYQKCIKKIDAKESKFNKVVYDARFNNDKLESMKISHDTLLDYTEKIVEENDLLKQIICDKYPFILVDEYQDTNRKVIMTLSALNKYSTEIQHDFFVGYYGDVKQDIYDTGVGSDFYDIHKGLIRIKKTFNRRSAKEIISIANQIRNDDLKQEPIYEDFPEGSVSFYNMNISRQEFINAHIEKWNITEKNKLHCFELTNELVAQQSGFENIYNFYKNSAWYKVGKRYEFLRDHVLSLDIKKLGVTQILFFRILDFKFRINQNKTVVSDVIFEKIAQNINILELTNLLTKFKNATGETLKDYIESLFSQYHNGDDKYDKNLEYIIGDDIKSYSDVEEFILNQLYLFDEQNEQSDADILKSKEDVSKFLEININEFDLWHTFIIDKCGSDTIYHTYHGTKGREFDNVIVFMNAKFGSDREYFSRLLKVLSIKDEKAERNTNIEEARNLLYVAVTRTILNLSFLYLDDIGDSKVQVEHVFGEIKYDI